MKKCFILDHDRRVQIVGSVDDQNEGSMANKFTQGLKLEKDELPRGLEVSVEIGLPTYPPFFTLQQTPIVSDEVLARLKKAGVDNLEVFPVKIVEPNRKVPGYNVINIIGRLSCVDLNKTVGTKFKTKLARVKKLALDLSRVPDDLLLFRMQEFPLAIVCRETVKDAVEGLPNVVISPAQGWSDKAWF